MRTKRPFFKHYAKIYKNEFKGYNGGKLVKDVLAGLTVAAVALPLALAFGAASVPSNPTFGISAGLITAILAGLVTGALGGGSFQISGPTGAMTVVLGSIIATYGVQGMFFACFVAGAILLIAGLLRLGKLIQFIPRPVVTGFTSGIAIVIALGQLGNFFGVSLQGESTVDKVVYFFTDCLSQINLTSVILSVCTVIFLFVYPKKLQKYVPGSLVAIILLTAIVALIPAISTKTIGEIPKSIINSETLSFSAFTGDMVLNLIGPSFTIAALGMIESLLCGTCAANMKNEKFDSNVELIAQGIGNMAVPFFGGVPSTAAIARTSVAIKAGGQTRLTSVFQSAFLLVCMFTLSNVIGLVPYSALAGVLVVTAWRMNEWKTIKSYFTHKLWDAVAMFTITMVATVFLDLTYAIIIGVLLSLFIMVSRLSRIRIETSDLGNQLAGGDKTSLVYCTGALFFANAKELEKSIEKAEDGHDIFVIVFRGIVYLDVSAVSQLSDLVKNLREQGKDVCFTGVREEIQRVFDRTGFTEELGENNFYATVDKYIEEKITQA